MLRLAVLLPLLPACLPRGDVARSLDDVDQLDLSIRIQSAPTGATVSIDIDGAHDCIAFDESFGVRVAGRYTSRGRDRVQVGSDDIEFCDMPSVQMHIPPEACAAGAALEVRDDSRSLMFDLGDALVARRATWVAPADGLVSAGERLVLRWSPASDLASGTIGVVAGSQSDRSFELVRDAGADTVAGVLPALRYPAEILFLSVGYASRPVPCDRATCRLGTSASTELAVDAR